MEKINYKEFKMFLDSDVDEATYFGYSKEDLISLKERLEGLRERFDICESRIEGDREKIEQAYNNISGITYNDYRKNLTFNDGKSSYYLTKDEEKNIYKINWYASSESSILTNMKLVKYRSLGRKFSREIDNIIENSVKYFNKENTIESVSSIFTLEDNYKSSLLNCNNLPFFFIDKKTLAPDKYIIIPFDESLEDRKQLTTEDKQKLLTKIMVPRGFLN